MKKILGIAIAVVLATMSAHAQKLTVVDSDGLPIPYATIMTPQAEMIGTTNLDGIFDTEGFKDLVVTHVAFKTKIVKMGSSDARITLEDADFNMPEITVSPKPFVYVQTYYRMYYTDRDGIVYYRAGLTDNVYDTEKQKMSSSTKHVAKASKGIIKTVLGVLGGKLDKVSHLSPNKMEDRILRVGKASQTKIIDAGPGKKQITDNKGIVGSITDDMDNHQRRFAYDSQKMYNHRIEATNNTKELEKRQKRSANKQNEVENDFCIYHIDEAGNYAPEDFVMMQYLSSYDEIRDSIPEHIVIAMQVFATDRAYVTKSELKERKKANKIKLNYANIRQFERDHHIPPLANTVQQKLNELWKAPEE